MSSDRLRFPLSLHSRVFDPHFLALRPFTFPWPKLLLVFRPTYPALGPLILFKVRPKPTVTVSEQLTTETLTVCA